MSLLSEELNPNRRLKDKFNKVKDEWFKLARSFILPGLGENWVEYCENLDKTAFDLLRPQIQESSIGWDPVDIFNLCCSIYLHKIGLIPNNFQKLSTIFSRYNLYSKDHILKFREKFGLENIRAADIAWICYGHRDFIDHNRIKQDTLSTDELKSTIWQGSKTRQVIACYLRILSRLGSVSYRLPNLFIELYFKNRTMTDYIEMKMNSVISNIEIITADVDRCKILIKLKLHKNEIVTDNLRLLQSAKNTLISEFKICSDYLNYPEKWFFVNSNVTLDTVSLSKEIESNVMEKSFLESMKNAIENSLRRLLKSRVPRKYLYGLGRPSIKGWGPKILIEQRRPIYKDARVANTSEVFLGFTGWPIIKDRIDEKLQSKIRTAIHLGVKSFDIVRKWNFNERKDKLEKKVVELEMNLEISRGMFKNQIKEQINNLQGKIELEEKYEPLTSLTHKVPTMRVNSLAVLAFTHLFTEMEEYLKDTSISNRIFDMMSGSIHWICKTDTGPFAEKIMKKISEENIFQILMSLKALINSRNNFKKFSLNTEIQNSFPQKVAEFVHEFIDGYHLNENWLKDPFKAMALEILIYYYHEKNTIFIRKPEVEGLIKNIANELLSKANFENFSLWEDDPAILRDEEESNIKDWTHVTSVWAIEGLCKCKLANMLDERQEKRLFQILPLVLLKQDDDGFYESTLTEKFVFKTAIYTYALAQAYKIFH